MSRSPPAGEALECDCSPRLWALLSERGLRCKPESSQRIMPVFACIKNQEFRIAGTRERVGYLAGVWRDVVLMESQQVRWTLVQSQSLTSIRRPLIMMNTAAMDIYEQIVQLRREGRRGAVATITNVRGSIPSFQTAKMLVRDDGSIVGTIGGGCVEAEVWQAAREVMEEEKPRTLTFNLNNNPKYDTGLVCGGTLDIFIEPVLPSALLYIFGAGHVAFNLYRVAMIAGFDVTVVDDRESYANRERFPDARGVFAADFDGVTERLHIPEAAYVVIVTRGHRDDMRVLRWAINLNARYLGMIGSRRKTISIYKELETEGVPVEKFANIHAPVGLEIGAVTPEEIAVAIVAEMIAVRRHALPNIASKAYNYTALRTSAEDSQDAVQETSGND